VTRFEGHTSSVLSVALSPDGRWALAGALDRTVRLWELATGKAVWTFEGDDAAVRCVAFSPDGRRIVSAALDGTLRSWTLSGILPAQ
jgi:WD40 repeat protein